MMIVDPSRGVPEGQPVTYGLVWVAGPSWQRKLGAQRMQLAHRSMELFLLGYSVGEIALHVVNLPLSALFSV